MTLRQLQNVMTVSDNQTVKINDAKNYRSITTPGGWIIEPDYDYEGFNYEEVERLMNRKVASCEFNNDCLIVWIY